MMVVMSFFIFNPMSVLVCPECHRTPRGRATATRPPHTAALGVAGERTGATVELVEREASNGALPGTGCLVPGKAEVSNFF